MPALIGILTVSDRASRGEYADEGGPAIRGYLSEVLASPWEPREQIVPDDLDAIAAAIREVHAGRTGVRRGCLRGPARAADDMLTARETEVLALLRQGASNAQIGRALAISELTVKSHIRSMMEKLQASDRTGVVGRAFDLGLLKAGDR